MSHHPVADELIARNGRYASDDHLGGLRAEPSRQVTVVTCMDARIDVEMMLGLERGEAHVLRNAGGVLTDDVVRSVALSQRLLGTREVILIHHTACGLHGLDEAAFLDELTRAAGAARPGRLEALPTRRPTSPVRCANCRTTSSWPIAITCEASSSISRQGSSTRSRRETAEPATRS